ncbi:MAG: hypothetical protein WCX85_03640 [Bacilli bacterium]|jgi:cell division septal protein FtsQ|nr:hypothetical protein [Bacilli bacterium]
MADIKEKTAEEIAEIKKKQKALSSRRIFILFVVIDILLVGVVLYEMIFIALEAFKS